MATTAARRHSSVILGRPADFRPKLCLITENPKGSSDIARISRHLESLDLNCRHSTLAVEVSVMASLVSRLAMEFLIGAYSESQGSHSSIVTSTLDRSRPASLAV